MADPSGAPTVVRPSPPPKAMLAVTNPIIRSVLSSRWHRPMSTGLMVLTFTGRKSGRTYSTPVGRHDLDGVLTVVTGAPWRLNFRGGAPVTVTLEGQRRKGHAELVEDPDEVARAYGTLLERVGVRHARRLGLKITGQRNPTLQEIRDGLPGHALVRIRLDG